MGWKLLTGAFVFGAVGAGVAVYFAAKKTSDDLTGQSATMRAAYEQMGRLTATQLQAKADAFAANLLAVAPEKIRAAAMTAAQEVVEVEYGITPQFISDAQQLATLAASARSNPLATLRGYL